MLYDSIRPVGGLEETLVDKLAVLFFRLLRLYIADMKIAPKLFRRVAEILGPGQPAVKTKWTSPDDQVIVVQRDPTTTYCLQRHRGKALEGDDCGRTKAIWNRKMELLAVGSCFLTLTTVELKPKISRDVDPLAGGLAVSSLVSETLRRANQSFARTR